MPTPTTQELLQQAENFLDEIDDRIAAIEPDRNQASAMLVSVGPIRDDLADFINRWEQIITRMNVYVNALTEPTTEQGYKDALDLFEIILAPVEDLDDTNRWANVQRLQNAYKAVQNTINKIATEFAGGSSPTNDNKLRAALLFIDVFGGTEFRLEPGSNPDNPNSAASTGIIASGPVIYLYLTVGSNTNHLHTTENIVHEFGHVLVFRNGTDNSEIYKEWYVSWDGDVTHLGIGQYISTPFTPQEGWGSNAGELQNTSIVDIEQERLANMFEAFITGYQPNTAYDPSATDEQRERRAAWALWTFMSGTPPPYDPNAPDDPERTVWIDNARNTRPVGSGLMYWLQFYEDQ
jgi:hypothetical protein